jgi:hypothetical protein
VALIQVSSSQDTDEQAAELSAVGFRADVQGFLAVGRPLWPSLLRATGHCADTGMFSCPCELGGEPGSAARGYQ